MTVVRSSGSTSNGGKPTLASTWQPCGVFPSGDALSMFNRNGFNYFGVDELTKVWEHYAKGPSRLIQTVAVLRLVVSSDIAWLLCELKYRRVAPVSEELVAGNTDQVFGSKATEIYRDGNGRPDWKMWHFHSSALQPDGESRPAFDDEAPSTNWAQPTRSAMTYTYTLEGHAGRAILERIPPS